MVMVCVASEGVLPLVKMSELACTFVMHTRSFYLKHSYVYNLTSQLEC